MRKTCINWRIFSLINWTESNSLGEWRLEEAIENPLTRGSRTCIEGSSIDWLQFVVDCLIYRSLKTICMRSFLLHILLQSIDVTESCKASRDFSQTWQAFPLHGQAVHCAVSFLCSVLPVKNFWLGTNSYKFLKLNFWISFMSQSFCEKLHILLFTTTDMKSSFRMSCKAVVLT